MIDIKRIRQNPEQVEAALCSRGINVDAQTILQNDEERRQLLFQAEEKKARRNAAGKRIGLARKNKAGESEINAIMEEMRSLGDEIEVLDSRIAELDQIIEDDILSLPNLPHSSVPSGDETARQSTVRLNGTPRQFEWEPKTYQELGTDLAIADELNGQTVYFGQGAKLRRGLVNFLMEQFAGIGYEELILPADMSALSSYHEKILDGTRLPILNSNCSVKSYAGIELTQLTRSETSYEALEAMTAGVELVFQTLSLPCRISERSCKELDFTAAKSYAIEVWLPSTQRYMEAASCTNSEDFLSRSFSIRTRSTSKEKPQHVHTLCCNLCIDTLYQAVLENFQNGDGSVTIPEALICFTGISLIPKNFKRIGT